MKALQVSGESTSFRLHNATWLFCVVFGLVLISQVQVAGDGMWFWYAHALNENRLLYRDLHLALQPLYPVLTAVCIRLLGVSWVASKSLAALALLAYTLCLRGLSGLIQGSERIRAAALLLGFAGPLIFEASRFDDYHVITDICSLCVLLLLIKRCLAGESMQRLLICEVLLGVACGVAFSTRVNDGLMLFLSVCSVLVLWRKRWWGIGYVFLSAGLVVAVVITMSGDSFADWFTYSIVAAMSAKGGSGSIAMSPLYLVRSAFQMFRHNSGYLLTEVSLAIFVVAIAAANTRGRGRAKVQAIGCALIVLIVIVAHWGFEEIPISVFVLSVPLSLALSMGIVIRHLTAKRQKRNGSQLELLVLIPTCQLLSGAMSSGGNFLPLTSALSLFLLTAPLAFPSIAEKAHLRIVYVASALTIAVASLGFKAVHPFRWYGYEAPPLFANRVLYRHPVYGDMIIDKALLSKMESICSTIRSAKYPGVLSSPLPYANYFCAVEPWHGYVQTFFDTSTSGQIRALIDQLATSPPGVIIYERRLKALEFHEQTFNHGHPLPQRELDKFVIGRIRGGSWSVVNQQCFGHSNWLSIVTSPAPIASRGMPADPTESYLCD